MARTVRDANLETRNARVKLKVAGKPYYRGMDSGLHLGYRKGKTAGKWLSRRYEGDGEYEFHKIGLADDTQDADGLAILTFAQAQEAARNWFSEREHVAAGSLKKHEGPYTVRIALVDYLDDYRERSNRSTGLIKTTIDAHIMPALGDVEVVKLNRQQIRDWHRGIANTPARLRTAPGQKQKYREAPSTEDAIRQRRSAANRILSILKAALNHAFHEGYVLSDAAWKAVKPFKNVDSPKIRYLTDAESKRLVNTSDDALKRLVTAALLTGARYGELGALKAEDFDAKAKSIYIGRSKSGKARHIALTDEGVDFFQAQVAGKKRLDHVFNRTSGGAWGRAHQTRPIKEACERAKITPVIGFHILRHTYASRLAMNGVPMSVIAAQLGHSDTRMTEKHYAHLAPSYVADTVRAAFSHIGLMPETNVETIHRS